MSKSQNKSIATDDTKTPIEIGTINIEVKTDIKKEYLYNKEISTLLNDLSGRSYNGTYVFRGYNRKQEMLPKIIRKDDLKDDDLADLEISLLRNFEKYGLQYINVVNEIDFVSYAQHFGLSTRLLDFTYNPFIALYFALYEEKSNDISEYEDEEDFKYYYIQQCNVKEQICMNSPPKFRGMSFGSYEVVSLANIYKSMLRKLDFVYKEPNTDMNKDYIKAIYRNLENEKLDENSFVQDLGNKFTNKKLLFIDANQSNQRLVMQQGLFLLPYTLNKNELKSSIKNNTEIIRIDKKLRGGLIKYLDRIGINSYRLMPDLTSICAAVERETRKARRKKQL